MRRCFLGLALLALSSFPALAQEEVVPGDPSYGYYSNWLIGPAFKLDGWAIGPHPLETHDQLIGLQVFHRMMPTFGTGASLFFAPGDSEFEFNLDGRWIWPLPAVEPYAGAQLSYLTRNNGGISISFKPGLLAQVPGLPLQLDLFALARYDFIQALFGSQNPNQLMLGAGAVLQYQLPQ